MRTLRNTSLNASHMKSDEIDVGEQIIHVVSELLNCRNVTQAKKGLIRWARRKVMF